MSIQKKNANFIWPQSISIWRLICIYANCEIKTKFIYARGGFTLFAGNVKNMQHKEVQKNEFQGSRRLKIKKKYHLSQEKQITGLILVNDPAYATSSLCGMEYYLKGGGRRVGMRAYKGYGVI